MNKKRLSVVMAGAMLASSVAPVLAAEVTKEEKSANELGLLQKELRELLPTKVFSEGDALEGQSVYAIYVNGKDTGLSLTSQQSQWQRVFNSLDTGDVVEVYSKGFKEENGKVLSKEYKEAVYGKYETAKQLKDLKDAINALTTPSSGKLSGLLNKNAATFDENSQRVVVTFKEDIGHLGASNNSIVIGLGDDLINPEQYKNEAGKAVNVSSATTAKVFYGFAKAAPIVAAGAQDIPGSAIRHITITPGGYDLSVTDLYDGLMLTTAGHDLLSAIKEVTRDGKSNTTVTFKTLRGEEFDKADGVVKGSTAYDTKVELPKVDSEYGFVVTITDAFGKTTKYTVKGAEKQTNVVATWLYSELARVDILAGANRYETAVAIAKEQALVGKGHLGESNGNPKSNIVLVNGNSLVDGLSAAPLASVLEAGDAAAPVLLTEADELPRATKLYLKELLDKKIVGDLDTKIHLVGGTTVLSRSLEKELENMGFKVVRYNGDNREETSLKVAKKIEKLGGVKDKAFVVGAEGEADAMSISGYASTESIPVIVSKKGGLTYDGLKELEDKAVTVLGGENSVSAKEFEAIKEEADAVRRISGANRQATNAAIIREFYHGEYLGTIDGVKEVKSVIVAKDGRANKTQLVDALTAANLAAQFNAPVVLATEKLSDEQVEALQLRAKSSKSLYQVGHGVERSVVETIASKLGLLNK